MARLVIHVDIDIPDDNDPMECADELLYGNGGTAYGMFGDLVHAIWDPE